MTPGITKAVILTAGEGTRMRPLTYTRPKGMLPVANKPILEHVVIEMQKSGIREFIFIVGFHAEQIIGYFLVCNTRKLLFFLIIYQINLILLLHDYYL